MKIVDDIIKEVEKEIASSGQKVAAKNVGYVREVKDEVVFIDGLQDSPYGEMVDFGNNIKGMIVDLYEDSVGAIVFGEYEKIVEGSQVKGSG